MVSIPKKETTVRTTNSTHEKQATMMMGMTMLGKEMGSAYSIDIISGDVRQVAELQLDGCDLGCTGMGAPLWVPCMTGQQVHVSVRHCGSAPEAG